MAVAAWEPLDTWFGRKRPRVARNVLFEAALEW
jgi:hypothetical protein